MIFLKIKTLTLYPKFRWRVYVCVCLSACVHVCVCVNAFCLLFFTDVLKWMIVLFLTSPRNVNEDSLYVCCYHCNLTILYVQSLRVMNWYSNQCLDILTILQSFNVRNGQESNQDIFLCLCLFHRNSCLNRCQRVQSKTFRLYL